MTRINTLPAELLLDEHLLAAHREGLRPVNEIHSGKGSINKAPTRYKLGSGHVKFARKHLLWTVRQFMEARNECFDRGFSVKDYEADLSDISARYLNDYRPTRADHRHNLARICERWRKRSKAYHFNGVKVDDVKTFREYLNMVKLELGL